MGCFGSKEVDLNAVGLATNEAYGGQAGKSDGDPSAAVASVLGQSGIATARIELSIKCSGLKDKDVFSKSDPMVVISRLDSNTTQWIEIGRTEIVANSLNPVFMRRIITPFHFEEVQSLKFDIYDIDTSFTSSDPRNINLSRQDYLGCSEVILGDIIRQPGSTWSGNLTNKQGSKPNRGTVTVQAEQLANSNVDIWMKLRCVNLENIETFGNIEPFLRIFRIREDGTYSPVYKTEVKKGKNPVFDEISAPLLQLSNGDMFRPLKIEVVDYERSGKHRVLGDIEISLDSIQKLPTGSGLPLVNRIHPGKSGGELFCDKFVAQKRIGFLDFIQGGTELSFLVAVDFTASNGDPSDSSSLHYVDPHGRALNPYASAITSVGRIVEFYDSDKTFALYGFGGKPHGQAVSHCFALNGNESDPRVLGINGIIAAYYDSLNKVHLSGPTLLANIIEQAAAFAASTPQSQTQQKYYVLLIITDGTINDMENTVDAIVAASNLPLSILIVGVGNADFTSMDTLDSDGKLLVGRRGKATRDIVQFVPMNSVNGLTGKTRESTLAQELLAEIPTQLTSYYKSLGIGPNPQRPASAYAATTPVGTGYSYIPPPPSSGPPAQGFPAGIVPTPPPPPAAQPQYYQQQQPPPPAYNPAVPQPPSPAYGQPQYPQHPGYAAAPLPPQQQQLYGQQQPPIYGQGGYAPLPPQGGYAPLPPGGYAQPPPPGGYAPPPPQGYPPQQQRY